MQVVVQKFGCSSVADTEKIRRCARRAAAAKEAGKAVVVVVSAMGDTTDELLALAERVGPSCPKRELDQLLATGEQVSTALMAMTLCALGHEAVSLTGVQCGIRTDGPHTRAQIRTIDRERLDRELAAGRIPVVAGFQGGTDGGEVTTLGRGGSDTTAVALAAALGAEVCEIYTDVDGVYTADPRVVSDARLMERISYDEMMEAASQGAKVMHLRAVELGKKYGVPIRVLHSHRGEAGGGTLIVREQTAAMEGRAVSAVALKTRIGRITITGLENRPGVQESIFGPIAEAGISVDDIIQNEFDPTEEQAAAGETPPHHGRCNIAFTVERADLEDVRGVIERALGLAKGRRGDHRRDACATEGGERRDGAPAGLLVDVGLSKVSVVGVGMQSQPGVAATMFRALGDAGIRISNITTAEIKISCLVDEADGERALRVVHAAFGLGDG